MRAAREVCNFNARCRGGTRFLMPAQRKIAAGSEFGAPPTGGACMLQIFRLS
jgi:hypothetical protein